MQTAEIIRPQHSLIVKLAVRSDEVEQAMRLRYTVFVEEAKNLHLFNESGMEHDDYDEYCDHLIVKDLDLEKVVGTYRLLPGTRAIEHNGFYSETEFDLSAFKENKLHTLELGRSCIAPEYRDGKAVQMLWGGIANYIIEQPHKCLIGCASLHLKSIREISEIYSLLKTKKVINDRYGIRPLDTHRIEGLQQIQIELNEKEMLRRLPPLMKGYRWLGAEIGGEPAYDEVFNTIDFFIMLETQCVAKRYRRHFLT